MSDNKTQPRQLRIYPETAEAIKVMQEKTGMATAELLKVWQKAFERIGEEGAGRDSVKARIGNIEGHFVAVVDEMKAMASDLQAHQESDGEKIRELTEKNADQVKELEAKDKQVADLQKVLAAVQQDNKKMAKEVQRLTAENDKLKSIITDKLDKL
jgi:septal ring factor EnvC (AmiA/AmiB activator)